MASGSRLPALQGTRRRGSTACSARGRRLRGQAPVPAAAPSTKRKASSAPKTSHSAGVPCPRPRAKQPEQAGAFGQAGGHQQRHGQRLAPGRDALGRLQHARLAVDEDQRQRAPPARQRRQPRRRRPAPTGISSVADEGLARHPRGARIEEHVAARAAAGRSRARRSAGPAPTSATPHEQQPGQAPALRAGQAPRRRSARRRRRRR